MISICFLNSTLGSSDGAATGGGGTYDTVGAAGEGGGLELLALPVGTGAELPPEADSLTGAGVHDAKIDMHITRQRMMPVSAFAFLISFNPFFEN